MAARRDRRTSRSVAPALGRQDRHGDDLDTEDGVRAEALSATSGGVTWGGSWPAVMAGIEEDAAGSADDVLEGVTEGRRPPRR